MIIAVPRRAETVGPDALQIGGQIAGAAAGDEQVPAELKILRDARVALFSRRTNRGKSISGTN